MVISVLTYALRSVFFKNLPLIPMSVIESISLSNSSEVLTSRMRCDPNLNVLVLALMQYSRELCPVHLLGLPSLDEGIERQETGLMLSL
jgi:hypothetical protein